MIKELTVVTNPNLLNDTYVLNNVPVREQQVR